jgi:hypothetical protein
MPDGPKGLERFPWDEMRAAIESGAIRTWGDLQAKYGVSESGLLKRRKQDEEAGRPWPLPHKRPKTEGEQTAAPSNVVPFPTAAAPSRRKAGRSADAAPPSAPKRQPLRSDGDEESASLLDSSESPLFGEESFDGTLLGQQITAGLLDQVVHGILRKLVRGKVKPSPYQSQADVWNSGLDAVKKATLLQREIAGLTSGTPSIPKDDSADKVEEIRFIVVTEQTGTEG